MKKMAKQFKKDFIVECLLVGLVDQEYSVDWIEQNVVSVTVSSLNVVQIILGKFFLLSFIQIK
jgi:hypothetical protein